METIFNLPVAQPPDRDSWHHRDLLHTRGHPVNRAGLAVDTSFRPVDDKGRPVWPDLFAAGTILAGQDWMREKCGSGLSIATAYAAVQAVRRFLDQT
jgi:glycerol-3-phosphate dehydrogenase subunit B